MAAGNAPGEGEQGEGTFTRQGLEESVSDCVISLDVKLAHHVATRTLRVVKYRGSSHSPDEYPFLITDRGVTVMPITSLGLAHEASSERISSGSAAVDELLGGKGFFRGSTVLVSGAAGTGKTSAAAYLANSACKRGEKCMYFAFEESASQIARNMRSIGVDLDPWVRRGLLRVQAPRPTALGLEAPRSLLIVIAHPRDSDGWVDAARTVWARTGIAANSSVKVNMEFFMCVRGR